MMPQNRVPSCEFQAIFTHFLRFTCIEISKMFLKKSDVNMAKINLQTTELSRWPKDLKSKTTTF